MVGSAHSGEGPLRQQCGFLRAAPEGITKGSELNAAALGMFGEHLTPGLCWDAGGGAALPLGNITQEVKVGRGR